MPAEFRPERASPPASVKVRMSGPSSRRMRSTTPVSAHSARQSQFWPCSSTPSALASGSASAAVQPSGKCFAACCRRAATTISVRAFISTTAANGSPAPSAMPRISST